MALYIDHINEFASELDEIEDDEFTEKSISESLNNHLLKYNLDKKLYFKTLRYILTGKEDGISIISIIRFIGRKETQQRVYTFYVHALQQRTIFLESLLEKTNKVY